MHTESAGPRGADGSRIERAIILQLLRSGHEQPWSQAELAAELGVDAVELEQTLGGLQKEGVVCVGEGTVWAARATKRLDELGLIGI